MARMSRTLVRSGIAVGALLIAAVLFAGRGSGSTVEALVGIPGATLDDSLAASSGQRTAVFAGGCFWGLQLVFEHVRGVTGVEAGYAGGSAGTATYEQVSTDRTGHAESVRITYDPSRVTYGELLRVFFGVAHDPTQRDRQGPDVGTPYRSVIFYGDDDQRRIAQAYIAQLEGAKTFERPIVTQLVALRGFYPAEAYHQDYAARHPTSLYIVINDRPKVERLRKQLPALYRAQRVTYAAADAAS